jgi:hypothetical protein
MRGDHTTTPYLLTPLPKQRLRDLVCTLYLLATGHRLRRELRVPGQGDAETVRQTLRRIEWGTGDERA